MEGTHWLATMKEVGHVEVGRVSRVVQAALARAGGTVVGQTEHVFDDGAVTLCCLLREGHCTVRTYPDRAAMWCDCLCSGASFDLRTFKQVLISGVQAVYTESTTVERSW